jgi:peptidoglycan/LPS O-acetylase OafA/YrhL
MTIESLPASRDNNFNLLRMLAASAVTVSHSFPLSLGAGAVEPLEHFLGFSVGAAAVKCFFAISGYFVLLSFDRRKSNFDFIMARVLRIIPALLAVSLLLSFVAGMAFTALTVGNYLSSPATWSYPVRAASIVFNRDSLPGVFVANPYPRSVNGSLWTLRFEVTCYAMLFGFGVAGLCRRKFFLVFLAAYAVTYFLFRAHGWTNWTSLSLPFVVGMSAYTYRNRPFVNAPAAIILLILAITSSLLHRPVPELWSFAIGYGSLWLGFVKLPRLHAYNRLGDYSYGTYIYAFPIQQSIAASRPHLLPWQMMALTFPPTFLFAVLSWHLIESPAITLRRRIALPYRMLRWWRPTAKANRI